MIDPEEFSEIPLWLLSDVGLAVGIVVVDDDWVDVGEEASEGDNGDRSLTGWSIPLVQTFESISQLEFISWH